jgi:hypothetical protein
MQAAMEFPDGLIAVVKRACPTCTLVAPVLAQIERRGAPLAAHTQDDAAFPQGVRTVRDDSAGGAAHARLAADRGLRRTT